MGGWQWSADPRGWQFPTGSVDEVRPVSGLFGVDALPAEVVLGHTVRTARSSGRPSSRHFRRKSGHAGTIWGFIAINAGAVATDVKHTRMCLRSPVLVPSGECRQCMNAPSGNRGGA